MSFNPIAQVGDTVQLVPIDTQVTGLAQAGTATVDVDVPVGSRPIGVSGRSGVIDVICLAVQGSPASESRRVAIVASGMLAPVPGEYIGSTTVDGSLYHVFHLGVATVLPPIGE